MSTGFFVYGRTAVASSGIPTLTATIPGFYDTPVGFNGALYNAPPPNFSLGPPALNSNISTPLYVNTSVINQGGTGVLTDDLLLFQNGIWGIGDSAGFTVSSTGELQLESELKFVNRASGPIRKMYWIQTLTGQSFIQTIILTIDATKAKAWNGIYDTKRASPYLNNPAYYQINTLDSDYPITSTYMTVPVPGITYPIGIPDAKIFDGTMKKAIYSGTAAQTNIVLHPDLVATGYFALTQGKGQDKPDAGLSYVPTLNSTAFAGPGDRLLSYWDFSGLWINNLRNGNGNAIKFQYCNFDASALNNYLTYSSPGGVGPDNQFVLKNVQVDMTDPTYCTFTASNIADLRQNSMAAFGTYGDPTNNTAGQATWRTIAPSLFSTQGDGNWNPQGYANANAMTTVTPTGITIRDSVMHPITVTITKGSSKGIDSIGRPLNTNPLTDYKLVNITSIKGTGSSPPDYSASGAKVGSDSKSIDWSLSDSTEPVIGTLITVTYNFVPIFPNNTCFIIHPPGFGAQERFTLDVLIAPSETSGFEYCKFDNSVSAQKFGGPCQNQVTFGFGGFGIQNNNGVFRGMQYCIVANSPQDSLDIGSGYRGHNVISSSCRADGSHVDSMQIGGIAYYPSNIFNSEYEYHFIIAGFLKQENFADPIVNGITTNPWLLAYANGADVTKMKFKVGGIDAAYYYEFGGITNLNLGSSEVKYNIIRCGNYGISALSGPSPRVAFTNTNPMTISHSATSKPNLVNATTYGLNQSYPGYQQYLDSDILSVVAFDTPVTGAVLPTGILPHKLYRIVGYSYGLIDVKIINVTGGCAVNDMFAFNTGTLSVGGSHTTIRATAVSNGIPTAFQLVNPGSYRYRPTSLNMVALAPSSAVGTLTIENCAGIDGNFQSFVLGDYTTLTPINGSTITVGCSTPAGPLSTGGTVVVVPNATAMPNTNTANTMKNQSLGLSIFHDNWIQGSTISASIYMQTYGKDKAGNVQYNQYDSEGNPRNPFDTFVMNNNRWLFNAPPLSPIYVPDDGNGPLVGIGALMPANYTTILPVTAANLNPPPGVINSLNAFINNTNTIQLYFIRDPNARISPDSLAVNNPVGYQVVNPSGYRYRLTPFSTPNSPGSWKYIPALTFMDSTHRSVSFTDTSLASGDTQYLFEMQSVSTYSMPAMTPQQSGTIASANLYTNNVNSQTAPTVTGAPVQNQYLTLNTSNLAGLFYNPQNYTLSYSFNIYRNGVDAGVVTLDSQNRYQLGTVDVGSYVQIAVIATGGGFTSSPNLSTATSIISAPYDTSSISLFGAMSTTPTDNHKIALDLLIKGLKTDGLWQIPALERIWALRGPNLGVIQLDLYNINSALVVTGAGTANPIYSNTGWSGNGVSFLTASNTSTSWKALRNNPLSLGVYTTLPNSSPGWDVGGVIGMNTKTAPGPIQASLAGSTTSTAYTSTTTPHHIIIQRENDGTNNIIFYLDGNLLQSSSITPIVISTTAELIIGAATNSVSGTNGNATGSPSAKTLVAVHVGNGKLSPAQVTLLKGRLDAYASANIS